MGVTFHVRDFLAPVRIGRLRRTFERTQYLPPDDLRAYQDARLRRIVAHACRTVPYYQSLFASLGLRAADIRTADDLKRLPTLSRDAVRRAGRQLWRRGGRRRFRTVHTSGTSGQPVTIAVDRAANAQEFVHYWRYWGWAGYRLGDRFAMFDPYLFMHRRRLSGRAWHWQPLLARLVLNPVALTHERVGEIVMGLRRFAPRFLKGHASDLYLLALLCRAHGIGDVRFQAVFPTAEMLLPRYRLCVEGTFGGRALDGYGHMERVVAVTQCERGGYHVHADYGVFQMEDVRPRGPGGRRMGRVVGTSLHNLAMPLLRYEVGDLVEPAEPSAACPCGRTLPLIQAIHGREEDVVTTPDGRIVTGLYTVWQEVPEVEFGQVEQEGADHLTALVVPGPHYGPAEERRLAAALAYFLGPTMRFDIRHIGRDQVKRTPDGKIRLVIAARGFSQAASDGAGNGG